MLGYFDEVAGYLQKYGWQQDMLGSDGGPRCLHGAMCSRPMPTQDTYDFLAETIAEQFPDRVAYARYGSAVDFNDHEDTTLADILMVLDKSQRRLDELVGF